MKRLGFVMHTARRSAPTAGERKASATRKAAISALAGAHDYIQAHPGDPETDLAADALLSAARKRVESER